MGIFRAEVDVVLRCGDAGVTHYLLNRGGVEVQFGGGCSCGVAAGIWWEIPNADSLHAFVIIRVKLVSVTVIEFIAEFLIVDK